MNSLPVILCLSPLCLLIRETTLTRQRITYIVKYLFVSLGYFLSSCLSISYA